MLFKKYTIAVIIILVLIPYVIAAPCEKNTDTGSWGGEGCKQFLTDVIINPSGTSFEGTFDQDITVNGITFPAGSHISVSGNGEVTTDKAVVNGQTVSLNNAKINSDGSIASATSIKTDTGNYQNAQNLKVESGKTTADSVKYFESGTTTFINAEGVKFSPNLFYVAKADSISYLGATSTKVIDFTGESGTFSVKSADRVIVETMTFDN